MGLPSFASLRPTGLTQAAVSGVGGARPPHISIDQNRFSLVDSTGNVKQLPPIVTGQTAVVALDVVFIDANPKPSKIYWGTTPYTPNSINPPVCFADNGIAPSSQALQPQSPTCAACPHNAIGSAISKFSGASIKACQDFKKLAAVVSGQGVDDIEFLMQIKPGSFKNWSTYINWLKTQKMADGSSPELFDVVTRMTFESQGVLKFEPVAAVAGNAALEAQIVAAWQKGSTGDLVGKNDTPFAGQLAAPAPMAPAVLPPPPTPHLGGATTSPFPAPPAAVQTPPAGFAPSAAPEAPKRRRRTKEEMEAERRNAPLPGQNTMPFVSGLQDVPATGAPVAQDTPLDIPPFLQRQNGNGTPTPPPTQNTGMAQPQPMPAGLAAQLDKAFEFPK